MTTAPEITALKRRTTDREAGRWPAVDRRLLDREQFAFVVRHDGGWAVRTDGGGVAVPCANEWAAHQYATRHNQHLSAVNAMRKYRKPEGEPS